ncbi:hypothetical protein GCM10023188_27600 [Pontibacter saemangeumensis]|uniref:Helix-turn-helix domain-containing protein n=1 Tax=Pontibacter saemangeumensis TaxID=1084525 RepID=A0ABP8LSA5_9BACT
MTHNPFENIDNRLRSIETMIQYLSEMLAAQHQPQRAVTGHNLTVKDAADMLKVSVSTIYSHVSKQTIPVCKRGNRLYFSEEDLLSWVRAGRNVTVDEMRREAVQNTVNQFKKRKNKHY